MADTQKSVAIPPLEDFLKAGAHFGHKSSRWNPKMEEYIYTNRNGVHIIDLVKTMKLLKEAIDSVVKYSDRGSILIVGTKGQAASIVKNVAEEKGAFYVNTRWPGGLFTNFKMIKRSVNNLIQMEEELASGAPGLVKKEQLLLKRDVNRLNRLYEGIKFMEKIPTAVIVVDSRLEKNAIKEANNAGVPVVALVDTNCDPETIDHPIPANDDSIKSIKLFVGLLGEAIGSGQRSERVVSLRNSHVAKLESLKREHERAEQLRIQQEEEDRERLKKLRAGEEVPEKSSVVRVTKKDDKSEDSNLVRVTKKESLEVDAEEPSVVRVAKKKSAAKGSKVENKTVEDLDLPTRTVKALQEAGIKNVKELKGMTKKDLMNIKGVGEVAAKSILDVQKKK